MNAVHILFFLQNLTKNTILSEIAYDLQHMIVSFKFIILVQVFKQKLVIIYFIRIINVYICFSLPLKLKYLTKTFVLRYKMTLYGNSHYNGQGKWS